MPTAPLANVDDLALHDHACWVSRPGDGQRRRIVDYLCTGFAQGERVAYFGAPAQRTDAVAADLAAAGVAVSDLVSAGRLVLGSAEREYLGDGAFDPGRRLAEY